MFLCIALVYNEGMNVMIFIILAGMMWAAIAWGSELKKDNEALHKLLDLRDEEYFDWCEHG